MAYATGTITSATPYQQISTNIQALFNQDATGGREPTRNWSFVEQIPAGTGAGQSGNASYTADVYKCAGSGTDANSAAQDIYCVMMISTTGTTAAQWNIARDYKSIAANPGDADRAKFRGFTSAAGSATPNGTYYTKSETYSTASTVTGSFGTNGTLNTNGVVYWIYLTNNSLVVTVRSGGSYSTWGMTYFDTISNQTDTYPFARMGDSTNTSMFLTLPMVTSGSAGADMWKVDTQYLFVGHTHPHPSTPDLWAGSGAANTRCWFSRMLLRHLGGISPSSNLATYGGYRGLMPTTMLSNNMETYIMPGDTVTIDGDTWTCVGDWGSSSNGLFVRAIS